MSANPPRRSARQQNYASATDTSGTDDPPAPPRSSRSSRSSRAPANGKGRPASFSRTINLDIEVDVTPAGGSRRRSQPARRAQIEEVDEEDSEQSERTERTFRSRETPRASRGPRQSERDRTPRVQAVKRQSAAARPSVGGMPFTERVNTMTALARDCLSKVLSSDEGIRMDEGSKAWMALQTFRDQRMFKPPAPLVVELRQFLRRLPEGTTYHPADTPASLDLSNLCNFIWTILNPEDLPFASPEHSREGTPRPSGRSAPVEELRKRVEKTNELLFLAWKKFWIVVIPREMRGSDSALKLWLDFATLISRIWQCPTITSPSAPHPSLPAIPESTLQTLFSPSAISKYGQWSLSPDDPTDSDSSDTPDPQSEKGQVTARWRSLVRRRQKELDEKKPEVLARHFVWSKFTTEVCAFIRVELDGGEALLSSNARRAGNEDEEATAESAPESEVEDALKVERESKKPSTVSPIKEAVTLPQASIGIPADFARFAAQLQREEPAAAGPSRTGTQAPRPVDLDNMMPTTQEMVGYRPPAAGEVRASGARAGPPLQAQPSIRLADFRRFAEQLAAGEADEAALDDIMPSTQEMRGSGRTGRPESTVHAGPSRPVQQEQEEEGEIDIDDLMPSTQEMVGAGRRRTSGPAAQTQPSSEAEEELEVDDLMPSTQEMSGRGQREVEGRKSAPAAGPPTSAAGPAEAEDDTEEDIDDLMPSTQELGIRRPSGSANPPAPAAGSSDDGEEAEAEEEEPDEAPTPRVTKGRFGGDVQAPPKFNFAKRQHAAERIEWDSQPTTAGSARAALPPQYMRRTRPAKSPAPGTSNAAAPMRPQFMRRTRPDRSATPPASSSGALPMRPQYMRRARPEKAATPEQPAKRTKATSVASGSGAGLIEPPSSQKRRRPPASAEFIAEPGVFSASEAEEDEVLGDIGLGGGAESSPDPNDEEEEASAPALSAVQKGKGRAVVPSASLEVVRAPSYRHEDHNDLHPQDFDMDNGEYAPGPGIYGSDEDDKPGLDDEDGGGDGEGGRKRRRGEDGDNDEEEEEEEEPRRPGLPSSSTRGSGAHAGPRSKRLRTRRRSNEYVEPTLSEQEEDRRLLAHRRSNQRGASADAGPSHHQREDSQAPPESEESTPPSQTPPPYQRRKPSAGRQGGNDDRDHPDSNSGSEDDDGYIDEHMVDHDGEPLSTDGRFVYPPRYMPDKSEKHGRLRHQTTTYSRLSGVRKWTREEELLLYRTVQKVPCWLDYPLRVVWYMHGPNGLLGNELEEFSIPTMKDKMRTVLDVRWNNGLPIVGNARGFLKPLHPLRKEFDEERGRVIRGEGVGERARWARAAGRGTGGRRQQQVQGGKRKRDEEDSEESEESEESEGDDEDGQETSKERRARERREREEESERMRKEKEEMKHREDKLKAANAAKVAKTKAIQRAIKLEKERRKAEADLQKAREEAEALGLELDEDEDDGPADDEEGEDQPAAPAARAAGAEEENGARGAGWELESDQESGDENNAGPSRPPPASQVRKGPVRPRKSTAPASAEREDQSDHEARDGNSASTSQPPSPSQAERGRGRPRKIQPPPSSAPNQQSPSPEPEAEAQPGTKPAPKRKPRRSQKAPASPQPSPSPEREPEAGQASLSPRRSTRTRSAASAAVTPARATRARAARAISSSAPVVEVVVSRTAASASGSGAGISRPRPSFARKSVRERPAASAVAEAIPEASDEDGDEDEDGFEKEEGGDEDSDDDDDDLALDEASATGSDSPPPPTPPRGPNGERPVQMMRRTNPDPEPKGERPVQLMRRTDPGRSAPVEAEDSDEEGEEGDAEDEGGAGEANAEGGEDEDGSESESDVPEGASLESEDEEKGAETAVETQAAAEAEKVRRAMILRRLNE